MKLKMILITTMSTKYHLCKLIIIAISSLQKHQSYIFQYYHEVTAVYVNYILTLLKRITVVYKNISHISFSEKCYKHTWDYLVPLTIAHTLLFLQGYIYNRERLYISVQNYIINFFTLCNVTIAQKFIN